MRGVSIIVPLRPDGAGETIVVRAAELYSDGCAGARVYA